MPERDKPAVADIDEDPNVTLRPFSSPPCYAHEVDPAYFGFPDRRTLLRDALRDAEAAVAAASQALARL